MDEKKKYDMLQIEQNHPEKNHDIIEEMVLICLHTGHDLTL